MVFIITPSGKTLCLDLNPSTTTLRRLKESIHAKCSIPASHQRLISSCNVRLLSADESLLLSQLRVGSGSTLTLHIPLLGGIPHRRCYRSATTIGGAVAGGAGRGRGKPEVEEEDEGEDKGYDENQKFDEFQGNDVGLSASAEYDEDDKETDAVWEAMDKRVDSREEVRREARLGQETEKYRASDPKITEQSADLKRKLHTKSAQEWVRRPQIGDDSLRNKRKRFDSVVPMPDTLLEKARREQEHVTALDPKSRAAGGTETPWSQTPVTDLTAVGEGRGTVLSVKVDRLSNSVSGLPAVDPKGYYPPGWIVAARLEEVAGRIQAARKLIQKGCEECPESEDVWIEACRLASPDEAKAVIGKGVKSIPTSVKLWMQAAKLEHDKVNKSGVLRNGLEHIPDSVWLWKALVELSDEENARAFLHRAVESCPLHVELWLALVRLETYDNAKKVLHRARERLPKEPAIWITGAKLEEAIGNTSTVGKIIGIGIRELQREGVVIDRELWMKEAEGAERAGSVTTCQAIIHNTIGIGVEEEDRERTWVADAEECKKRGSIETARAIYAHALTVFLMKKSIWLKAVQLEKCYGTKESLDACKAVVCGPQAEVLVLLGAKEKWLAGDVPAARAILQEAYANIPNSEEIWLAAFKLEFENNEPERARMLLAKARERGGTERVWRKSAIVEREMGNTEEERRLLDEGLMRFPSFFKLWLMLGQLEERLEHFKQAKEVYESGLKHCSSCIPLWVFLAKLEEKTNGLSRARAVLTLARKKNPAKDELWLAAIHAESRHGNKKEADRLMAKALQECPTSGILWAASIEMAPRFQRKTMTADAFKKCKNDRHVFVALALAVIRAESGHGNKKEADRLMAKALQECPTSGILWAASIEMAPRPQRKTKTADAFKKCHYDPHVFVALAKLFWHDGKMDKARTWLNWAVTLEPDVGDFWALYYNFELQHGTEDTQKDVLMRCVASEPKYGEKWQVISKAVENSHQPTEAILKKVVLALGNEEAENSKN